MRHKAMARDAHRPPAEPLRTEDSMASWLQRPHQLPRRARIFGCANDDATSVRTLADDISAFEPTISLRLDWCGV